jgi:hypothetical protein
MNRQVESYSALNVGPSPTAPAVNCRAQVEMAERRLSAIAAITTSCDPMTKSYIRRCHPRKAAISLSA